MSKRKTQQTARNGLLCISKLQADLAREREARRVVDRALFLATSPKGAIRTLRQNIADPRVFPHAHDRELIASVLDIIEAIVEDRLRK